MNPDVDCHALAPEIVLVGDDRRRADRRPASADDRGAWQTSRDRRHRRARRADPGRSRSRSTAPTASMFGGAYVVDTTRSCSRASSSSSTYVVAAAVGRLHRRRRLLPGRVLLPAAHVGARHDASWRRRRDLITIFVALETISIPDVRARRRGASTTAKSNEAAIKYYLIGVLSSAVMLYGMSLDLRRHRLDAARPTSPRTIGDARHARRCSSSAIFLTLVGFAFKVSAVPFHFWAPDTYEGAPTPVTAFLVGRVEGRRVRGAAHDRLLRVLPGRSDVVAAGALGARGARR